jgi:ribosomal protein L11 methyltransferase
MTASDVAEGEDLALQIKVVVDVETRDAARTVAGVIEETLDPPPNALSLFEVPRAGLAASYRIDAYFDDAPDLIALAQAFSEMGVVGASTPRIESVPNVNWVALSQAALPPVEAGRFIVHGSHDAVRVGRRRGAILIDAGEAFGTAHHQTTHGCLEALGQLAHVMKPRRVLDLGCGSGVLAIAASRLMPHATILASDIDPTSVDVARENSRLNGAGSRVRVVVSAGFQHPALHQGKAFDLIMANILARPLIALAGDIRHRLAVGGIAVLSGLLVTQAEQVSAAYRASGFRMVRRADRTGWTTLVLQRV